MISRLKQHWGLNLKHLIEAKRSYKTTFIQLIPPFLLIILSVLSTPHPRVVHKPVIPFDSSLPPSCGGNTLCKRILWGPITGSNHDKMTAFAKQTEMNIAPFGFDVQQHADSHQYDIIAYDNILDDYKPNLDWITSQGLTVHAFITFLGCDTSSSDCTTYLISTNDTITTSYGSVTRPTWSDGLHMSMQKAVYRLQVGREASVDFSTKDYPDLNDKTLTTVWQYEILIVLFSLCFGLIFTFYPIVIESESHMRGYLKSMGLPDWIYWSSWFHHRLIFYTITTCTLLILGHSLPYIRLFRDCDVIIMIITLFSFGLSFISWSLAWTTIIRKPKTALSAGFFFFLIAIVLSIVSSVMGPSDSQEMENPGTEGWYTHRSMYLFPPWHATRLLSTMQYLSAPNHTDPNVHHKFAWEDLFRPAFNYTWTEKTDKRPIYHWGMSRQPVEYVLGMWVNIVVYGLLIIYLDKVWPDVNKTTLYPWFFFTPSYWKGRPSRSTPPTSDRPHITDPDVMAEYEAAMDSASSLKIQGLSKKFTSAANMNPEPALRDLFLAGDSGSVIALLGHNGAGKSTTINILTGKLSATSGDATMFGSSIHHDMSSIQRSIGICPQSDILWADLTAREHVRVMSLIKGETFADALDTLKKVDMHDVEQLISEQFSGGMKRRLQVVMSLLGDPRILILDEPTTGMDPINRRNVWELIREKKGGKLIFLTTHSMEEAEVLGEKVAIMVDGQLKSVGSSLHLKNKHATGYRLQLIAVDDREDDVVEFMMHLIPQAQLTERSGSNLIFAITSDDEDQIGRVLDSLQKKSRSSIDDDDNVEQNANDKIIRDWGLSNSTLEDVFLQVTRTPSVNCP
ncbi:ABC transporter A family protein [Planoprotostelium fungivorum]|uniref:ABC transporter A family protein n=1 Tax=Planoprotostelium fungivorum TaxID=1890364 RepID=A0A2P6NJ57_9EUKA|nr:ABC transporter A family protein [Planoprotostelium fungivorum]